MIKLRSSPIFRQREETFSLKRHQLLTLASEAQLTRFNAVPRDVTVAPVRILEESDIPPASFERLAAWLKRLLQRRIVEEIERLRDMEQQTYRYLGSPIPRPPSAGLRCRRERSSRLGFVTTLLRSSSDDRAVVRQRFRELPRSANSNTPATTVLYWINHRAANGRHRCLVLVHDGPPLHGGRSSRRGMRGSRPRAARSACRRELTRRTRAIRQSLIAAGIPIRHKTTTGINHWKMMLYKACPGYQRAPEESISPPPTSPTARTRRSMPYNTRTTSTRPSTSPTTRARQELHDEVTTTIWLDTGATTRTWRMSQPAWFSSYPIYPISPDLNFPPDQDYQDRVVAQLKLETTQVDAMMFRITSAKIPDELIKRGAGRVPVRLITDQNQYRNTTYFWHSYNVDRMCMAGVEVKWKDDASGQDMHQKASSCTGSTGRQIWPSSGRRTGRRLPQTRSASTTTSRRSRGSCSGSSISSTASGTTKAPLDGGAISPPMFLDFAPGFPETPVYVAPPTRRRAREASVTLRWEGGWWAHKYDIYFGTTSTPPLVVQDSRRDRRRLASAPTKSRTPSRASSRASPTIGESSARRWRTAQAGWHPCQPKGQGPTYSFTTSGGGAIPPAPTSLSAQPVSPTRVDLSLDRRGWRRGLQGRAQAREQLDMERRSERPLRMSCPTRIPTAA